MGVGKHSNELPGIFTGRGTFLCIVVHKIELSIYFVLFFYRSKEFDFAATRGSNNGAPRGWSSSEFFRNRRGGRVDGDESS